MDPQIVTYICAGILVVVLAISYVHYRKNKDDKQTSDSQSTSQILREAGEYLGIQSNEANSRMDTALDLAPMKMVSSFFSPKNASPSRKKRR